jgi:hypothetical protein
MVATSLSKIKLKSKTTLLEGGEVDSPRLINLIQLFMLEILLVVFQRASKYFLV